MTRKHFIFIADILREIKEPLSRHGDCWMLVVLAFAQALSLKYIRFNKDKFLHYCTKEVHAKSSRL